MEREFDIVIFGLTGYVGYYVARELLLNIQNDSDERIRKLKWAVAGRSLAKLEAKLAELNDELPFDFASIVKIEADVRDFESLVRMAKRTRIVVNTVGPYGKYGKPVVEACIQEHAHHLDIAAEISYFESCVLDYDDICKKNETLVISTCGWDVIPVDIGIQFLRQNFTGTLHSVESYAKVLIGPKGYPINIGTPHSILCDYSFRRICEGISIRKRLNTEFFSKELPSSKKTIWWKCYPFQNKHIEGWNLLFPSCDKSVCHRTQRHNFDEFNERPVQLQSYYTLRTFPRLLGLCGLVSIMGIFNITPWTRRILVENPETLTFGYTSLKGPSKEQVDTTFFETLLVGKGWSEEVEDVTKEPKGKMNKTVVVKVEGSDPAYKATATFSVQCALTVFLEPDRIPKGGVATPGYAFRSTSLMERLQRYGIKFTVEKC